LGKQSLDFYLPEYKVAIECQGIQHFIPSEYFGGEKRFERTKKLDSIKNKICEENGIKIIYYSHYNYKCDFEMITDLSTLKDNIYGIKSV
jgi:very-short-patch-repair endonuclease